jgi:hypothetical protein
MAQSGQVSFGRPARRPSGRRSRLFNMELYSLLKNSISVLLLGGAAPGPPEGPVLARWGVERFTAAINAPFSVPALAAEGARRHALEFFSKPFSPRQPHLQLQ